MNKQEVIKLIENALEADENSLSEGDVLESIDLWDSLATVSFMAMVDENFGVAISPSDISKCNTVKDLIALIGDKVSE